MHRQRYVSSSPPADGGAHVRTIDRGEYRYIPGPFQYSAGVAAHPDTPSSASVLPIRFPLPRASGGSRPSCAMRPPADGVLRLRTAVSRAIHRRRLHCLQPRICRHTRSLGDFRRQSQPGRPQQRMPGDRPARDPELPCLLLRHPGCWAGRSFVCAGSGEAREGSGPYRDKTIRHGETTPDAIAEKARFVLEVMEQRMAGLEGGWSSATGVQVYTVHECIPFWLPRSWRAAPPGMA